MLQKYKCSLRLIVLFVASAVFAACSTTQQTINRSKKQPATQQKQVVPLPKNLERPVPNPIGYEIPDRFKQAVENGTRTKSGKPGPDYWQQFSEYDINVKIFPERKFLKASGSIVYHNNSPDTLSRLYLEIVQNYRSGDEVDAVNMEYFAVNGNELTVMQSQSNAGYSIHGTVMLVVPPQPVLPGETVKLEMKWNFTIPEHGGGYRMGYDKDNLFYIGYWYPQMRVYDDVIGWFTAPFKGLEFYHGFGSYQVSITVPDQWIVAATGTLHNAKKLLQEDIYNRLMKAYEGTDIVKVVGTDDFGEVTITAEDGFLTWEYTADRVTDFAFSVTKESIWKATTTPVGDIDGDGKTEFTKINAFYRTSAPLWKHAARYAQHVIKFLSNFTGLPYPWPHMTAVEADGIAGGMEYPMMTAIAGYNWPEAKPSDLYSVIAHELAHMWVPMQLSTNERRYAWMDEGTTTFNEGQAQQAYPLASDFKPEISDFKVYLRIAGSDREPPMMRWSKHLYMGSYGVASYFKPASVLVALRGLLGKEVFMKAYHTFMDRWQFKHPYPWDLFSTFEDVSNRNLDWFWRSWYYTTWILDQSVADVNETPEGAKITIRDMGNVPMPANVKIWLANGKTITKHVDVKTWLHGAVKTIISVYAKSDVTKVVIDPKHKFPDANRDNNVWKI